MQIKFTRNGDTYADAVLVGWTDRAGDGWSFYPRREVLEAGRLPIIQRRTREEVECALGVFLSIPRSSAGVRK